MRRIRDGSPEQARVETAESRGPAISTPARVGAGPGRFPVDAHGAIDRFPPPQCRDRPGAAWVACRPCRGPTRSRPVARKSAPSLRNRSISARISSRVLLCRHRRLLIRRTQAVKGSQLVALCAKGIEYLADRLAELAFKPRKKVRHGNDSPSAPWSFCYHFPLNGTVHACGPALGHSGGAVALSCRAPAAAPPVAAG